MSAENADRVGLSSFFWGPTPQTPAGGNPRTPIMRGRSPRELSHSEAMPIWVWWWVGRSISSATATAKSS